MAWGEAHKPSPLSEVEQIRDRMRIEIAGRDAEIERLREDIRKADLQREQVRQQGAARANELRAELTATREIVQQVTDLVREFGDVGDYLNLGVQIADMWAEMASLPEHLNPEGTLDEPGARV